MQTVFLQVINLSIAGGWMILAVLLLRLFLRRAPSWIRCILWAMVGLRLLIPFTLTSPLSIAPKAYTIPLNISAQPVPAVDSGISLVDDTVNSLLSSAAPVVEDSANPLQIWLFVACIVWLAGVSAMGAYWLAAYLKLRRKTRARLPWRKRIWLCDGIASPFILGLARPQIYMPSTMDRHARELALGHELAHLARKDHWWKALGFFLLAVHWFNPLVWVAWVAFSRDLELACDARVVKGMNLSERKAYASVLLEWSVTGISTVLAFGENGIKSRIRLILQRKKPAAWITAAAVFTCLAVAVCFLTTPRNTPAGQNGQENAKIASLIATISASPAEQSSPGAYIAAHPAEYRQLLDGEVETLEYCFQQFLQGGQTGLEGHIMAIACQEIMEDLGEAWTEDGQYPTGQAWFNAMHTRASKLSTQLDPVQFQTEYPVSWLLMQQ